MEQITSCMALAAVSIMMAYRYFQDKERFRVVKTIATLDMAMVLLCLAFIL